MTTWVLVADRVSARLFSRMGRTLDLVRSFDNPEGRTRDQDLENGASHRTYDRHAHGRESVSSPHELAAIRFAKELAHELGVGRRDHSVGKIVLVAEPHFLGLLRHELDKTTEPLITTIPKDLAKAEVAVVAESVDSATL